MTDPVEAAVRLAVAIRDYWESRCALLYGSADLRDRERTELIELRSHLENHDFESARPIAEKWRSYREFQYEFADTLTDAARHRKLAELCRELLDLLPAE